MADDEIPFAEKVRSIQFIGGGRTRDKVVSEGYQDGHRVKVTTEGDPVNGSVTHVEHSVGDRVDATVAPATLSTGMTINEKG